MSIFSHPSVNADRIVRPIVLLVDDEENIIRALKRTLSRIGVDIVSAPSAREALYILENTEVDLIISDMRMPEMNGADFLAEVAQLYPDTLRYILTGYSDMESTIKAVNEGCIAGYLTKPWDDIALRELLERSLHSKLLEVRNRELSAELLQRNKELADLNQTLEQRVERRTLEIKQQSVVIEQSFNELSVSYHHMVKLASSIAAMREPEAAPAAGLRAQLAEMLARDIGLSEQEVSVIRDAALLAELGRVSFPDTLMGKAYSDYSKLELQIFGRNPLHAEAALMGIPGLVNAAAIVRSQYERYDGSGFPDKLVGDAIPLGARILAIVRDYIDLIRGRINGEHLPAAVARADILSFAGTRYDQVLAQRFVQLSADLLEDEFAINEQRLVANELKVGMKLARNLYSEKGIILLTEGHELTAGLIEKIIELQDMSDESLAILVRKSVNNCHGDEEGGV
ncbi:HD domain-containing phosphohydrolase [Thalassolituus sp.]|jgi:response regulator RpfG family c-di-GMP phosphodiesterase|uniref:HD domain-containing phosphohydrolase n=1 Tax=Thalassolituus sp. TaxID=2030822 RepID=UPI002A82F7F4|nr:HD domain-containing phosphohydrolase [Thalassolituus sp.]|tara:strand:- start:672 stop:2039 length:1368 start_codon:yes stop_codon:yes gene_type:complete